MLSSGQCQSPSRGSPQLPLYLPLGRQAHHLSMPRSVTQQPSFHRQPPSGCHAHFWSTLYTVIPTLDCPAHLPSMPRPVLWRRHAVLPVVWRHQGKGCQPAALDACIRKGAPACRQLGGVILQGGAWAVQTSHSMSGQARQGTAPPPSPGGACCLCRAKGAGQASSCCLTGNDVQGSVCPLVQACPLEQATAMHVSARVAGLHFLH